MPRQKLDYDRIKTLYEQTGDMKQVSRTLGYSYPSVRQALRIMSGKCYCGKPLVPKRKSCQSCLDNHKKWKKDRREKLISQGRCYSCDNPVSPHSIQYCDEHLALSSAKKHDWRIQVAQTPETRKAHRTSEYDRLRFSGLRETVLNRDQNRCVSCLTDSRRLHVHHKDHDSDHNTLDNLVTLCIVCHATVTRLLELDIDARHRLLSQLP